MNRRRVSLVDLGSNSARLVVYEYEPGLGFRLIDEIREVIRLGESVSRTGELTTDGIRRAVAALRTFEDYCRATGLPPVRIMATSAVRTAVNRDEFLDRVRELSVDIEVVDGETEASLGTLAVANGTTLRDAWVVDLGGGSMQLSLMEGRLHRWGVACPLGAISATERYFEHDPPRDKEVAALEDALQAALGDRWDELRDRGHPLVAMGGTVRNLAGAVQKRNGYPWLMKHGYFLRRDHLEELTEVLLARKAARRSRISGISAHRADIIVAGAVVFRHLLRQGDFEGIHISGYGVREGALFQEYLPNPHLLDDVRRASVRNLLWRFPQPVDHNERVVKLSRRLFDELRPLHGMGAREADLLEAAAWLHDVGKSIAFRDHEIHGEYLITSEPLPGFSHREQLMLALLVRYHRAGDPKTSPYGALLGKADRTTLWGLTVCLRLAEYLERSRTGRVRDLRTVIGKKTVKLELVAEGDPWVEVWETRKQAPLFESAWGRSLELEVKEE